jgi:flagellar basal body-associated protein FliL
LAKAETERVKAEAAEERIKAKEEAQVSYRNGQAETRKMIIDTETKAETKRIHRKYWIITVIMVLVSFLVLGAFIYWIATQQVISGGLKEAIDLLKYLIALGAFIGNALIIGKVFCGLDIEKIESKVRKRIEEKYKYLKDS